MTIQKTVELLIPCYNEEKVIEEFIEITNNILNNIKNYKFQFFFIDDGSSDNTLSILHTYHEKNPKKYHYLSFSRNFGKEAAIYAGLKNITSDYVIIMDADLEHPPELIPEFLKEIECGYEQVIAKRIQRKDSFFSDKFHYFMNLCCKNISLDYGTVDYRILSKKVIDAVLKLTETERYSRGIFDWVGFSKKYITYLNVKKNKRKSHWTFFSLFQYAMNGIFSFSDTFLVILFPIGIFILGISFLYLIVSFLLKDFIFLYFMILLLSGILQSSIGLISLYLKRIYWQVKNRPIYIETENTKHQEI